MSTKITRYDTWEEVLAKLNEIETGS